MTSKQLVEAIQKIVAEEVKKQLPEILSKMFLSEIVREQVGKPVKKKPSLAEMLEDEEDRDDRVPTPPKATDRGVYNVGTAKNMHVEQKKQFRSTPQMSEFLDRSKNPMASIYEDVKPLEQVEEETSSVDLKAAGFDLSKAARLAGVDKIQEDTRGPARETPEMRMRRIEELRRKLEVPA